MMRKYKFFTLPALFILCFAFAGDVSEAADAPEIQWQKSLGGSGKDAAYSIQQTTDGGYIVAGWSNSNDGDVTGNHGGFDYWVVKLGPDGAAPAGKKAIYVLPGYMGSKLYDGNKEIWFNGDEMKAEVLNWKLPFGNSSVFTQDANGTGIKVRAGNVGVDRYGSLDSYKLLVDQLQNTFYGEYQVIFYPFNWLADLNDSANSLAGDINSRGFDKVVFVTHSTGGLLASKYIAASSANRSKVEKAILIAAPLFGTYVGLQPIELGKTSDLDELLEENGIENSWGVTYPTIYAWVKAVTKNSPTTYQLFPSWEYLNVTPIMYRADFSSLLANIGEFYALLNGSGNINPNLTNGNARSHKNFRESFSGGVVDVLKQVDTTLIGCDFGYLTPAIAVYNKTGNKSKIEGNCSGLDNLRGSSHKNGS